MRPHKLFVPSLLVCELFLAITMLGQSSTNTMESRVSVALDFLRAMYPALVGKNLSASVETGLPFDNRDPAVEWLRVDIGEGRKGLILGYHGGCTSDPSNNPILERPLPPELPPNSLTHPPTASVDKNCEIGPVLSKQILSGHFRFGQNGGLVLFGLESTSISHFADCNAFADLILSHPGMSYEDVVKQLKNAGAKYGPMDKAEFTRDLPIKTLERVLGPLDNVSVDFPPLKENRNNVANWPDWTVTAESHAKDKPKVYYEFHFNQFDGELTYFSTNNKKRRGDS
jgi:hypothetical protein